VSSISTNKVAKGELVFTSFLLAIALVVLWDAINLKEVGINVIVGPKAFAIAIGSILLFLSSLQIIAVLRGDKGEPDEIEGGVLVEKSNWKALILVIGAFLFHIFTLELFGFIIATIPLFFIIAFALGERRWLRTLIVATVLTVGTYFAFTEGLQLQLPAGFEFLEPAPEVIIDENGEEVIVDESEEETW
jgi:putative tricarboxylic transport membrane protein